MATTNKTGWAAQLRWAVLAALGTAALAVTGNEARAEQLSPLEITPVMAVNEQNLIASVSDIEDAIAEVVVSDQRMGWLEGVDAVRVQVDNDLFAGDNQDRDYTGGMSITISGDRARDGLLSLDPLLRRLDRFVVNGEETQRPLRPADRPAGVHAEGHVGLGSATG